MRGPKSTSKKLSNESLNSWRIHLINLCKLLSKLTLRLPKIGMMPSDKWAPMIKVKKS